MGRDRLSIFHTTLLNELLLRRGLRRYYTLIYVPIVPQIAARFNTQFGNLLPAVEKTRGCAIIRLRREQSAWHTIQATDDLLIELNLAGEALGPGPKDRADNQPLLRIRSKAMAQGGEPGVVVVYLDEVRHLVGALVDGTTQLAEAEVGRHD